MQSIQGVVAGRVQGVGFRYFVQGAAVRDGVSGYAINNSDGTVSVLLCGTPDAVARVQAQVEMGPIGAKVKQVSWQEVSGKKCSGFTTG